jgi:hypothetical protein
MLTMIVHTGKPCFSVSVLHLGQEMSAKAESSKTQSLDPNNDQTCQRHAGSLFRKLIDCKARSSRDDGEGPSDDLETKQTGQNNSGWIEMKGLSKVQLEH